MISKFNIFIGLMILALLLTIVILNMNKDVRVVARKQGRMGAYLESETDNYDSEI